MTHESGEVRQSSRVVLRALAWRATPDVRQDSLGKLLVLTLGALVAALAADCVEAGWTSRFSFYGLNSAVAYLALLLAFVALVTPRPARMTVLSVMMAFTVLMSLLLIALMLFAPARFWETVGTGLWTGRDFQIATFLFFVIWWGGAVLAALRSADPSPYRGRARRLALIYAATLVAYAVVPHQPVFRGHDFDLRTANLWERARTLLEPEPPPPRRRVNRAWTELAQPALMDAAIEGLKPQERGQTDVYAIGIAGYAEQDVFIKELDGALAAFAKVLPVRERTLRLVNHVDTAKHTPAAIRANFAAAVRAIARKMDRDEDVLLLFMTSHGSQDGVALELPGLVNADLAPEDVAAVLDNEGIRNRIVIVSACYAGVFVKPLANDNTIVLTAADEKSTSFGCSNEREWTYFGDALFNHGLRPDASLEQAFADAKTKIGEWEARDGLPPSNPQAHFGPELTAKLARIYGTLRQAERAQTPIP
jgi:hypothetical protein